MSIVGGLRTLFGGRAGIFSDLCESAREESFQLMLSHARKMGANAVIGVRYDTGPMVGGCRSAVLWHGGGRRTARGGCIAGDVAVVGRARPLGHCQAVEASGPLRHRQAVSTAPSRVRPAPAGAGPLTRLSQEYSAIDGHREHDAAHPNRGSDEIIAQQGQRCGFSREHHDSAPATRRPGFRRRSGRTPSIPPSWRVPSGFAVRAARRSYAHPTMAPTTIINVVAVGK